MFSAEINKILALSGIYASQIGDPEISELIVLLAVLDEGEVINVIQEITGTATVLRGALLDAIEEMGADYQLQDRALQFGLSEPVKYVIANGTRLLPGRRQAEFGLDLLFLICSETPPEIPNKARAFMLANGVTSDAIGRWIQKKNASDQTSGNPANDRCDDTRSSTQRSFFRDPDADRLAASLSGMGDDRPIQSMLELYCEDRTLAAFNGQLEAIFNREEEIDRVVQILLRKKKNNPILLGEPGVGKTAIVDGLALRIVEGKVAGRLVGARVYSLDVGRLIGGTKWRGEFEERISKLLKELERTPGAILFIDEIHMIVGKGSLGDAADFLKPALASGKLTCIGATTHSEYMQYFDKDGALSRRFQPVYVKEPTRDQAVDMLKSLIDVYSSFHTVSYDAGSAEEAVDQSIRQITQRRLPDKAIDVLDEAGAWAKSSGQQSVSPALIRKVVASMAGRDQAETVTQEQLFEQLIDKIKGQDDACREIAAAMNRGNLGLSKGSGVKTVMLFTGEKGTGKEHAVKAMTDVTGLSLIRIDAADYPDHASMTRLIGSPPGYRDSEGGGQLTEAIRRKPSSILVIENYTSAYHELRKLVDDMLSKGIVSDSFGREINCRDVTVIFLQRTEAEPAKFGFIKGSEPTEATSLGQDIANVVDAVVTFRKISVEDMEKLVIQQVDVLKRRLHAAAIDLVVGPEVIEHVVRKGMENATACSGIKAVSDLIQKQIFALPLKRDTMIIMDIKQKVVCVHLREMVTA